LVETTDPEYFTLANFRTAVGELRELKKEDPDALRILDQLDAWVLETGVPDL
jgi:hypothetical protein